MPARRIAITEANVDKVSPDDGEFEFGNFVKAGSTQRYRHLEAGSKQADFGGTDSPGLSYYPQRWQSPLLSWTNYYIPSSN